MSNIVTVRARIIGSRPLFWHKFGRDALPLEKREKTGVAGHDPEEWRRTTLTDKSGQMYLDPSYIFATMREGARMGGHKVGKSGAIYAVQATLQITENRVMIDRFWPGYPNGQTFEAASVEPPPEDDDQPLYIDIRGVKNPNSKGRNIRYRVAASPGWSADFGLLFDKTVVATEMMHSILIDAGRLVGVGNGRTIGMGRFEVDRFVVEK